jgi:N-acetylglutamate synthase-like GNAT family acetyltransferase
LINQVQAIIRRATEADQPVINDIIREADINRMSLNWQRFIVAEVDGQVVSTGQIKIHKDGSHELASIATRPAYQGRRLASQVIQALLAQETEKLYLTCVDNNETFYQRFGFKRIYLREMPPYFRSMILFSKPLIWLYCLIKQAPLFEVIVMKQT